MSNHEHEKHHHEEDTITKTLEDVFLDRLTEEGKIFECGLMDIAVGVISVTLAVSKISILTDTDLTTELAGIIRPVIHKTVKFALENKKA